ARAAAGVGPQGTAPIATPFSQLFSGGMGAMIPQMAAQQAATASTGATMPAGHPFGYLIPQAQPVQAQGGIDPGLLATGMPGVTNGFMARLLGPGPGIRAQAQQHAFGMLKTHQDRMFAEQDRSRIGGAYQAVLSKVG